MTTLPASTIKFSDFNVAKGSASNATIKLSNMYSFATGVPASSTINASVLRGKSSVVAPTLIFGVDASTLVGAVGSSVLTIPLTAGGTITGTASMIAYYTAVDTPTTPSVDVTIVKQNGLNALYRPIIRVPLGGMSWGPNWTYFCVLKRDTASNPQAAPFFSVTSTQVYGNGNQIGVARNSGVNNPQTSLYVFKNGVSTSPAVSYVSALGGTYLAGSAVPKVYTVVVQDNPNMSFSFYLNGVLQGTITGTAPFGTVTMNNFNIDGYASASILFASPVCEASVYSGAMSQTEIDAKVATLRSKWGC